MTKAITGYVEPQGNIYLFSGVPLSPDHNDVIKISSNASGYSAISQYPLKVYSAETYTRTERGFLRIGDNAENLMTYNYMCWRNRSGSRYFYAFVTNVGYINENCTEIQYIIDNYMTWFDLVSLGQSFVEREIPETDNLFEHLIPENLNTGEYIQNTFDKFDLNNTRLLIQSSTDETGARPTYEDLYYTVINGIASGLMYEDFDMESADGRSLANGRIKRFIENGFGDNIVNISMVPEFCCRNMHYSVGSPLYAEEQKEIYMSKAFETYYPKNNKLYSYPYKMCVISNNTGGVATYKWENWESDNGIVRFYGICYGTPTVLCVPMYYRQIDLDFDSSLALTNFPVAPWSNDPYKAYLAQNKASISTGILGSVISGISNSAINANNAIGNQAINNNANTAISQLSSEMMRNVSLINLASGAINAGVNIASTLAKIEDTKAYPPTVHNLAQTDALNLVINKTQFNIYDMSIRAEQAKAIDNYFSAYGYAIHQIKTPNISSRNYWNYTKTNGCILNGSIPAQAKNDIIGMFDKGIRLWTNIQQIGNFSLPNEIGGL